MVGPVPAIHVCRRCRGAKTWIPGPRPRMTAEGLDERTATGDAPHPRLTSTGSLFAKARSPHAGRDRVPSTRPRDDAALVGPSRNLLTTGPRCALFPQVQSHALVHEL